MLKLECVDKHTTAVINGTGILQTLTYAIYRDPETNRYYLIQAAANSSAESGFTRLSVISRHPAMEALLTRIISATGYKNIIHLIEVDLDKKQALIYLPATLTLPDGEDLNTTLIWKYNHLKFVYDLGVSYLKFLYGDSNPAIITCRDDGALCIKSDSPEYPSYGHSLVLLPNGTVENDPGRVRGVIPRSHIFKDPQPKSVEGIPDVSLPWKLSIKMFRDHLASALLSQGHHHREIHTLLTRSATENVPEVRNAFDVIIADFKKGAFK